MNKISKLKSLILAPLVLGGGLMLSTAAHAYTMNVANTQFYTGSNYYSADIGAVASASFSSVLYEQRLTQAALGESYSASNNYGYTGSGFGWVNGYAPNNTGVSTTYNDSFPWCVSSNCILTLAYNFTSGTDGTLKIYANSTSVFNPSANPFDLTQTKAESGALLLSLVTSEFNTTLYSNGQIGFNGGFVANPSDSSALLNYLFEGPNTHVFLSTQGGTQVGVTYPDNQTTINDQGYFYQGGNGTGAYYAVPEPSDLGMMGLGLLMVGLMGLRFRQSRFRRS